MSRTYPASSFTLLVSRMWLWGQAEVAQEDIFGLVVESFRHIAGGARGSH